MFKSLDIDLYKNGYNVATVDCINIPIAGATGYFDYHNYFYYCFYCSLLNNWSATGSAPNRQFLDSTNTILNKLGLKMNAHQVEDMSQLVPLIKSNIDKAHPVIMIAKYKSLFYNTYYMDEEGNFPHGIVIHEYNSENSIIGIKETTLVREIISPYVDADIFFSLRLKEEMVEEIWKLSNDSFRDEKSEFLDTVYSLEKAGTPQINDYEDLVKDFLNNYNYSESFFAAFVQNVENYIELIKKNPKKVEFLRLTFFGSLNALFNGFEKLFEFESGSINSEKFYGFKNGYIKFRSSLLAKIHANILRGKSFNSSEKALLAESIRGWDEKLFSLVSELYGEYKKTAGDSSSNNYTYLNIKDYFNNEGFGLSLSEKCTADITGEGTYFLFNGIPEEEVWQAGKMKFHFVNKEADGQMDNISCSGQVIEVPENCYSRIMFLGCSEFGHYSELFEVNYADGKTENIKVSFSDFYQAPVFNEKIAWSGQAAHRKDGNARLHNFNARIFAAQYPIDKSGKLTAVKLPQRRNIHIFAITLI